MKRELGGVKRNFNIDKHIDKKKKSNRAHVVVGIFAVCLFFVYACHVLPLEYKVFFYNQTENIPYGVYLRVPLEKIRDGDYVVYTPQKETIDFAKERGLINDETYFLEMVGATEGETYSVDLKNFKFYANGKFYGVASISDKEMRPLPIMVGLHYVPNGEFLPVGTHPRSFDGRYTGCVPVENVLAKVVPLIIFD